MGVAQCGSCEKEDQMSVQYHHTADLRGRNSKLKPIEASHTILRRKTNPIGVTCGCYAKLHRQLTHIRLSMDARSKAKSTG